MSRESMETGELLQASQIDVILGTTPVLRQVDLSLSPGHKVAVLGPSGSGKSTLLHCLAGIIQPTSGDVRYRGRSISRENDVNRSQLRLREFGLVFQFADLVPELTLAENIALPLELTGVDRRTRAAKVEDALDRLGLVECARRRPHEVSGGQRQRAAVARAVIHGPSIIFADEPTGALDTENSAAVLSMLFDAVDRSRCALILVTHEESVADRCDTTVRIQDGRRLTPVTTA